MATFPTPSLTTERLALRRFTRADADLLLALDSDPEVMRYLNGGVPTPREDIESHTLPQLLRHYACLDGPAYWAAEERASGRFVGWFELRPTDEHDLSVVELGYRLNRPSWGKGYATEGARALVRVAFEELGVTRVYAETMTVNARSRRVMEKAGLAYVRTFFANWPEAIEGSEHGEVEYAVTTAGWPA